MKTSNCNCNSVKKSNNISNVSYSDIFQSSISIPDKIDFTMNRNTSNRHYRSNHKTYNDNISVAESESPDPNAFLFQSSVSQPQQPLHASLGLFTSSINKYKRNNNYSNSNSNSSSNNKLSSLFTSSEKQGYKNTQGNSNNNQLLSLFTNKRSSCGHKEKPKYKPKPQYRCANSWTSQCCFDILNIRNEISKRNEISFIEIEKNKPEPKCYKPKKKCPLILDTC